MEGPVVWARVDLLCLGTKPWVLVVLPSAGWCRGAAARGNSALCFTKQVTEGKAKDFASQPSVVAVNPGQVHGYVLLPSLLSSHFSEESSPPHHG